MKSLGLAGPWPNPATNQVEINLSNPSDGQRVIDLSLYDMNGHLVEKVLNAAIGNESTMNLRWTPKGTLSSGVYIWRLSSQGLSIEKSMIILH